MGIYDKPRESVAAPSAFPERVRDEPVRGSVIGAAFRRENLIGSALSAAPSGALLDDIAYEASFGAPPEDGFNPWDFLEGTEYEEHSTAFAGARSKDEFDLIAEAIDRELADAQIISQAGGRGVAASMLAGVVDVPSLLPGAAFARGAGVTVNAARVSLAAGAEAAMVEGILQSMQKTRTGAESAAAIGGSIVLGAILGGGAGAVLRKNAPDTYAAASRYLDGEDVDIPTQVDRSLDGFDQSLSAAQTARPVASQFDLRTASAQKLTDYTPRGVSFSRSFIGAKSPEAQKVGLQLVESAYAPKGSDDLDLGVSVETAQKIEYDKAAVRIGRAIGDSFNQYRKARSINAVNAAIGRVGPGNLTKHQFNEQVSRALRRGDVHEIPEVQAAAQKLRSEVLDPLKDKSIRLGLLPEDVEVSTAASYLTRMWDSRQLNGRASEFIDRLSAKFADDARRVRASEQTAFEQFEVNSAAAASARERARLARQSVYDETLKADAIEVSQEQIEQILDALRTKPKQPQTLLQRLAMKGLKDEGGELSHLDAGEWHKGKPGQLKLINEQGMDLDSAAELAQQEGYIVARDVRELMEKIDGELRGEPAFARSDADAAADYQDYIDLEAYAESIGITRGGTNLSKNTVKKISANSEQTRKALDALSSLESRSGPVEPRATVRDLSDDELASYARADAEDVFRTLTTQDNLPPGLGVTVNARGPFKERTLNVRDVDFEDFLINDAELVLNKHARTVTADVALAKKFGRADMKDQIETVKADYAKRIQDAKSEKEGRDLAAERDRIVDRLEAARDLLRGNYQMGVKAGTPHRVMQSLMTYNFIRALGGLVVSALPDFYRPVMVHGANAVFGGAVAPLIRNFKKYREVSKALADDAGIFEVALNNRLMSFADITDPISNRTAAERMLDGMGAFASTWSGGTYWNQFFKEVAVMVTTKRLRHMSGTPEDAAMLSRLGLTSAQGAEIQAAMKKNGIEAEGVFDPRTDKWDPRVREMYAGAMRADADTVVVTPGIGDKVPVVEGHQWLKPATQFKNFALAAHSRVTVAGLQGDRARFFSSVAAMSSIGMFVYAIKSAQSGRETSDNPMVWLAEGIDRSGTFPLIMEANNWIEGTGAPGVYSILSMGEEEASRYAVRSTGGKILGPTFGLVNDAAQTFRTGVSQINPLASEDAQKVTKGDISAARRLVPFGRHPGMKEYLDMWLVPNLKERIE